MPRVQFDFSSTPIGAKVIVPICIGYITPEEIESIVNAILKEEALFSASSDGSVARFSKVTFAIIDELQAFSPGAFGSPEIHMSEAEGNAWLKDPAQENQARDIWKEETKRWLKLPSISLSLKKFTSSDLSSNPDLHEVKFWNDWEQWNAEQGSCEAFAAKEKEFRLRYSDKREILLRYHINHLVGPRISQYLKDPRFIRWRNGNTHLLTTLLYSYVFKDLTSLALWIDENYNAIIYPKENTESHLKLLEYICTKTHKEVKFVPITLLNSPAPLISPPNENKESSTAPSKGKKISPRESFSLFPSAAAISDYGTKSSREETNTLAYLLTNGCSSVEQENWLLATLARRNLNPHSTSTSHEASRSTSANSTFQIE